MGDNNVGRLDCCQIWRCLWEMLSNPARNALDSSICPSKLSCTCAIASEGLQSSQSGLAKHLIRMAC